MSDRHKHLEFIQGVVNRLAGNSFQLKGWNVVLVSAIFALAASGEAPNLAWLAILPATALWGLDGYFLRQERLYRKLYDKVRLMAESEIDFSMSTEAFERDVDGWASVCVSKTLLPFHGAICAAVVVVAWYMSC